MRRAVSSLVFVLCLVLCLSCSHRDENGSVAELRIDEDALTASAPPESLDDKFAYVFGYKLAQALSQGVENADPLYITLGTYDAAHGTSLYTDEEMEDILASFQEEIFKRAEAAYNDISSSNLERAENYLETNGSRSSVVSLSPQVQYEVLRSGNEGGLVPSADSSVTISYQLVTLDGYSSGTPADQTYTVDLSSTIPGFVSVLTHMSEGEKVRAWIHPSQGYGPYGNGNIGPNELLIFDIDLVSVDD